MPTFIERLLEHASRTPKKTALRFFDDGSVSYAGLVEKALGESEYLKAHIPAPKTVILIFAPTGLDAMTTFLAAMFAGHIPSFMPLPSDRQDPELFWTHHRALFEHIGPCVVILPERFADTLHRYCPGAPLRIISLESCTASRTPPHPVATPITEDAVAFLQHSSGTTGVKKGVMLSYAQVERQVEAYAARSHVMPDSRIVSWLPLYHDMGFIACFILPLSLGLETVYLDPFKWVTRPHTLFKAITEHRGTHVWLPNFAFQHLCRTVSVQANSYDLTSVRAFINCSEPCKDETFERFLEKFATLGVSRGQLTTCYAMAETVFALSQSLPGAPLCRLLIDADAKSAIGVSILPSTETGRTETMLSCGRPLEGVTLRIVDNEGTALSEGRVGNIEARASFLFSGYYKDREASAAVLSDGWYKTRDLGFVMDGEIFVIGRADDVIIMNGRNFYAHEIEMVVSEVAGVIPGRSVAFGHYSQDVASHVLILAVESDTAHDLDAAKVVADRVCKRVFDVLNISPFDVVVLPPKTVIKTTSGKIHRAANRQRYEEGALKSWA